MLEWKGYEIDGETAGHLGLGFDVALGSVRTDAMSDRELTELASSPATGAGPVRRLFPAAADEFFRADRVTGGAELDAGFSILVVTRGSGALESEAGRLEIGRGRTVLVPDEAGPSRIDGDVEGIRCRPPRQPPEAAS